MTQLSDVSETALVTLRARVTEAGKKNPVLTDPVGKKCLDRILSLLPDERHQQFLNKKLSPVLTRYLAHRARKYDIETVDFLRKHPGGLVVNLGCGFDTRFWRLPDQGIKYIEVDLPEVLEMKKEVLGDLITYPLIKSSVLDEVWISHVASIQTENVLFMAEGLFMYLPEDKVVRTFKRIAETFSNSYIVFEVVHERYTHGIWKKTVEKKMKRSIDSTAGSSYFYGIRKAGDIEKYHEKIRIIGEWSYFEDRDVKPTFLRLFRFLKYFSRTQWTITAKIG